MAEELGPEIQTMFRLLSSLPPPKQNILDSSKQTCASCKKAHDAVDYPVYNSGVIDNVLEPLCKQCRNSFASCSKFVCCKCKMVIGWVTPHKDNDGFVFEKNHSYHIQACPNCTPGLIKADLIEKIIYLQRKQKGLI